MGQRGGTPKLGQLVALLSYLVNSSYSQIKVMACKSSRLVGRTLVLGEEGREAINVS